MSVAYNGKIIQIIEEKKDINWKKKIFERARRSPWVRVMIKNDKNQILLTREFRYELNDFDRRLPWWKVFDTLDEYASILDKWD